MAKNPTKSKKITKDTAVVHASIDAEANFGIVNVPVYHASTITSPNLDDYRNNRGRYDYGRIGTPTSEASEKAVAGLYGMDDCVSAPSGLSAVCLGISGVLACGDHALFPDSIYGSARKFVENILPRMGVEVEFYAPLIGGAEMAERFTAQTRLLYLESPGSQTFEMQDLPALIACAKRHDCLVAIDNTWGTAFHFDAVAHGVDVVIEAGTKYIAGHSDVSLGYVIANGATAKRIREYARFTGLCVAPDDHYLALRGLRTMHLRLRASEANGIALATWLEAQSEIVAVLHPALPSHPQHQAFCRDFTGSAGLFSFVFDETIPQKAIDALVDGLAFFGIGDSWGGYESLINQAKIKRTITALPQGTLLRIYAGLEHADDLIADLEAGFVRLRAKI